MKNLGTLVAAIAALALIKRILEGDRVCLCTGRVCICTGR
jgi:hypothetical protein